MDITTYSFFMGANSKDGFVSLFDEIGAEDPGRRLYIIKDGPGCGKSTLIGKIAGAFARPGERLEIIHCSGDPRARDGAIFHGRGLAVLDGTAPHIIDPALPGAAGGYIAGPPFVDLAGLEAKRPALETLKAAAAGHYAQAYRMIAAASRIEEGLRARLEPMFDRQRLARRADGIIGRELPRGKGAGKLRRRFLDGLTPDGPVCFWDTAKAMAGRIYVFEDTYGLAEPTLAALRDAALGRGLEVYACLCPKNPDRLRHVIIPEAGLAFVSAGGAAACPPARFRRVRVDAYIDAAALRPIRGRLRLLMRTADALLGDAVAELGAAREAHGRIEDLYRPHLDFAALDRRAGQVIALLGQGQTGT